MINLLELTKSNLRRKILQYFFTNPDEQLYLREIARKFKEDPSNLSKEMNRLEKDKIFISSFMGKQKYYRINKSYPLFDELKSIVFKTIGIKGRLEEIVSKATGILSSFIYGSFAKSTEDISSDIDLFIIIDKEKFDENELLPKINELESQISREINYNYYSLEEWKEKVENNDSFILNIISEPIIILKGKEIIGNCKS